MNSNSECPLDKRETLAVIRCIIRASQTPIILGGLNRVFKEKTGYNLPLYGYESVRDFLESAPDAVEITGSFPLEKVILASKDKSRSGSQSVKSQNKSKRRSFIETLKNNKKKEEVTKRVIPQPDSFKQEKETPQSRNFVQNISPMEHNNSRELKESVDTGEFRKSCDSIESRGSGATKESSQSGDSRKYRGPGVTKESNQSDDSKESSRSDLSMEFSESNGSKEFIGPVDSREFRESNSVNEVSSKSAVSTPKEFTANFNSLLRMYSPPQYKEKLNEKSKAKSSLSLPKQTTSTLAALPRPTSISKAASLTKPEPLPKPRSLHTEETPLRTRASPPTTPPPLQPTSPPTSASPLTSSSLSTAESPPTLESFPTPESDLLPKSFRTQEVTSFLLKSMVVYEDIPLINVRQHSVEDSFVEITPSWIQDPSMFYFRFRKFQPEYQNMARKLDKFYSFYEEVIPDIPEPLVKPGRLCVVPRTTHGVQKWYRGEILRLKNEFEVQVFLVDIGQVVVLDRSELKIFHRKLLELPKQSVRGYLANIRPAGTSLKWTFSASKRFRDLALNKDLVGVVVDYDPTGPADGGRLGLVLTNTLTRYEIHINDTLVGEGFAQHFVEDDFSEVWCAPEVPVTLDKKDFIERIIANSQRNALESAQVKADSDRDPSNQPNNNLDGRRA